MPWSYAQKVAVIPSFLHNPPLVYNHTPLIYIVKISPSAGAMSQLTIDFAEIFKSWAALKKEDMHRAKFPSLNYISPLYLRFLNSSKIPIPSFKSAMKRVISSSEIVRMSPNMFSRILSNFASFSSTRKSF